MMPENPLFVDAVFAIKAPFVAPKACIDTIRGKSKKFLIWLGGGGLGGISGMTRIFAMRESPADQVVLA